MGAADHAQAASLPLSVVAPESLLLITIVLNFACINNRQHA